MNGAHDLGGMHGFGPVVREENEPVFHAEWERHVYALNRSRPWLGYNIDQQRYAVEQMAPAAYLTSSYYERWLAGLEHNLVLKGVLSPGEIAARVAELEANPGADLPRRENPALLAQVERSLGMRADFERPLAAPPRFAVGDAVLTRRDQPRGHTRLPRYARGRRGFIHESHGGFVFPDSSALGQGDAPQHLYTVWFEARELWGDSAEPQQRVYLDLWESYLEPAS